MKKFKSMLKSKPNPTEQLKDWQRRLRQESRNIERQIRDLEREEKVVQKAIREAAKRNDMGSAKSLAREILGSRKAVSRLQENKAQLNSIAMHLGESVALARTVGHLSKSTEVMKLVNELTKAPEMAVTMQEFTKEITKAGLIEEVVNDTLDTALDSEDIEEETEEEVEKVLSQIAGETAAQLPEAVRKERIKLPAQGASGSREEEAIDGEMLVGPVRALFMDEISTGLDSSTTFQIVNSLGQSIHILRGTAVVSLLQPAPETYSLFDDIILLSDGQIVYQGPRESVLDFFEFMGFKCPERKGVADFLQEVTSRKDQEQYWARLHEPYRFVTVTEFAEAFQQSHSHCIQVQIR